MLTTGPAKRTEQSDKSQNILKPYSKTAAKELRRSRGEIACAECRRLKVRCDRQVPCSTCIARGCMALCPNGTLPPGEDSRHVSAATDHLQQKITKMEERMRALEDALAIAQAAESPLPHPLLTTGPMLGELDADDRDSDNVESVVESFGTLHIDETERMQRFYGPSGGSESLLIDDPRERHRSTPGTHEDIGPIDLRSLGLPEELDIFFHTFPLSPLGIPTDHIRVVIESYLPPRNRAEAICRCMLESMSWMFHIVSLHQFTQEIMPNIYGSGRRDEAGVTSPHRGPHALALFFITLSIGSLVDFSLPPYSEAAQRYYVLSLVALGLRPLTESASINTVKTLHLISIYCGMSGTETNMPNQYAILNLASCLAQKIGLHIDPTHWNMGERDVYDRRCYYWNLVQADLWQSTYSGRPPAIANTIGNCKIATEEDERKFQKGEYALGFGVWGCHYSEQCLAPVMKIVVAGKPLTYNTILDLDQKIRKMAPPPTIERSRNTSPSQLVAWYPRSHYQELLLLALHRSFFAQAIADHSSNPFESPYGYSFVTAYESACTVLRTTHEHFIRHAELFSRVWMIWSFNFMSAVIVGAVAARYKNLDIQPPPLQALQSACDTFERASKTNSRAAKALPVLLSMKDRALRLHQDTHPASSSSLQPTLQDTSSADEVSILRGKPRLIESSASVHTTPTQTRHQLHPHARSAPLVHTLARPQPGSYPPMEYTTPQPQWTAIPHAHTHAQANAPPSYPPHHPQPPMHTWAPTAGYPPPGPQTQGHTQANPRVDFSLEETWTNFLHQYGSMP